MNVLAAESSPTLVSVSPRTPVASKKPSAIATTNDKDNLEYLVKSFILELSYADKKDFETLLQVSQGALIAEVVLNFRSPGKTENLNGLRIYLDAPVMLALLDFDDEQSGIYVRELLNQAKQHGALLYTFDHCLEELTEIVRWTLRSFDYREQMTNALGRRLWRPAYLATVRDFVGAQKSFLKKLAVIVQSPPSTGYQWFSIENEQLLERNIGSYQKDLTRERDVKSIAAIVRLRAGLEPTRRDLAAARFIFLTGNDRLADMSANHMRRTYSEWREQIPACLGDRHLAGLLWLIFGGKGKDLSRAALLANCTSAIASKPEVINRMRAFLRDIDEPRAAHFEALMTHDRAALFAMGSVLGNAENLNRNNVQAIAEDLEKVLAGEKVIQEMSAHLSDAQAKIQQLMDENQKLGAKIEAIQM